MEGYSFRTVQDLIDWLEPHKHRLLILDMDGNTDYVDDSTIGIWNSKDPDSPIAIYQPLFQDLD